MEGTFGNLRLLPRDAFAVEETFAAPAAAQVAAPLALDPFELANRELLRPLNHRRSHAGIEPFSAAWFDELETKRFVRHGAWLPWALEFGRHRDESLLVLGPGLGSDAIRHLQLGADVTIAATPHDHPELIRANLARHGLTPRIASVSGSELPFGAGLFDVVVCNALHTAFDVPRLGDELFRVLKPGGKVIGLFPARFDTAFWQNRLMPLERLYWRRPPDPTTAPKFSAKDLRLALAKFGERRVYKRHLRRSELPYLWRVLPRPLLERLIGRVLVVKALKPLPVIHAVAAMRTNPIAA